MADSRLLVEETPEIHLLSVGQHFSNLSTKEKLYAHFRSRYGALAMFYYSQNLIVLVLPGMELGLYYARYLQNQMAFSILLWDYMPIVRAIGAL